MSGVYRMISNNQDQISSLEIHMQIEFLRSDREKAANGWTEESGTPEPSALTSWDKFYGKELETLEKLDHQCSRFPHWSSGAALTRDSYFPELAKRFAHEVGDLRASARWLNICIDWEKASEVLQADYTWVDFDGVTYWIHN